MTILTKVKFSSDKITNAPIALFLILTVAASLMAVLPIADAVTVSNQASYCYNSVSPNPTGVGQNALIVFWLNPFPADQQRYWAFASQRRESRAYAAPARRPALARIRAGTA